MRIASSYFNRTLANQMVSRQGQIAHLQEQIASGSRSLRPSDDPIGKGQVSLLRQAQLQLEQFDRNAGHAESSLVYEEGVLQGISNIMLNIRELTLQANSDSFSAAEREIFQNNLALQKQALLGLANSKDPKGDYLFSGTATTTKPYDSLDANEYQGNQESRLVSIGHGQDIVVGTPAADLFASVTTQPDGSRHTVNMLDTIARLDSALHAPIAVQDDHTVFHAEMRTVLEELDVSHNHITTLQSNAGFRLARIDQARSDNADMDLQVQTEIGSVENLDFAAAISSMESELTSLEALQTTYSRLENLSLFRRM